MRVSAVSYLNTWPLVWGFLHGEQRGLYDFRFDLPAVCAKAVADGEAEIGLVPCAEVERQGLDFLPDVGIACEGPVRSILLVSKKPYSEIRTLAADSSSRTSVALTRILLRERYGCKPMITRQAPELESMLAEADAALIIGDPALRLDPAALPYRAMDLGTEWTEFTGLPMVFAVWAGRARELARVDPAAFVASYRWGQAHLAEIVRRAKEERGFSEPVAHEYLTRYIQFELGPRHHEGLRRFREFVRTLD